MKKSRSVPGFTAEESELLVAIAEVWNAYDAKFPIGEASYDDLFTHLNQILGGKVLSKKVVTYLFEYAATGTDLLDWLIASHWKQLTPEQKFNAIEFNPCIEPKFHSLPIADYFHLSPYQQSSVLQLHPKYIKITQRDYAAATEAQKKQICFVITTVMIATGKSFHEVLSDAADA